MKLAALGAAALAAAVALAALRDAGGARMPAIELTFPAPAAGADTCWSAQRVAGDFALDADAVSLSAPGSAAGLALLDPVLELRLEGGSAPRAALWSAGAEVAAAPCSATERVRIRIVVRSSRVELLLDGQSAALYEATAPFGAARVGRLPERGGAFLEGLRAERLPWSDRTLVEGADPARLAALAALPASAAGTLEGFRLLEAPARLDPVFRVAAPDGGPALVIRAFGPRRPDQDVPPLEQALALAQIRPRLAVRVYAGESRAEVHGATPDGPFAVAAGPVFVEVDALVGCLDEAPVLTLSDASGERILDRSEPAGPAGRSVYAEVPDDCSELSAKLAIADRAPLLRTIRLVRGG